MSSSNDDISQNAVESHSAPHCDSAECTDVCAPVCEISSSDCDGQNRNSAVPFTHQTHAEASGNTSFSSNGDDSQIIRPLPNITAKNHPDTFGYTEDMQQLSSLSALTACPHNERMLFRKWMRKSRILNKIPDGDAHSEVVGMPTQNLLISRICDKLQLEQPNFMGFGSYENTLHYGHTTDQLSWLAKICDEFSLSAEERANLRQHAYMDSTITSIKRDEYLDSRAGNKRAQTYNDADKSARMQLHTVTEADIEDDMEMEE